MRRISAPDARAETPRMKAEPNASADLRVRRTARSMDPTTPPASQRVAIGAQTVRYVEGGSPDASRALLLFNGIGASVETAAPFMAGFDRTRVIAFDVPGVGESPAPLLPYRLADVAQLAADLLDHLGI
jgi:alpha-beta hydrolase superfamily lysophospholipase